MSSAFHDTDALAPTSDDDTIMLWTWIWRVHVTELQLNMYIRRYTLLIVPLTMWQEYHCYGWIGTSRHSELTSTVN